LGDDVDRAALDSAIAGNGGQYVYILPSHDMLLVRLGEWQVFSRADLVKFLAAVVAAFPPLKDAIETETESTK